MLLNCKACDGCRGYRFVSPRDLSTGEIDRDRLFEKDGSLWMKSKDDTETGYCIYLNEETGCTLSYEGRPTECSCHPIMPYGRYGSDQYCLDMSCPSAYGYLQTLMKGDPCALQIFSDGVERLKSDPDTWNWLYENYTSKYKVTVLLDKSMIEKE